MKDASRVAASSSNARAEDGLDPAGVPSAGWQYMAYGAVFSVFLALRVFVWSRTRMVEDHDSLGYIAIVGQFANRGLGFLSELGPTAAPLYPLLSSLVAPITSSSEQAVRLGSLLASVALFFAVLKIGNKLGGFLVAMLSVTILTFNPNHIPFSVSVLSEPMYLAFVFWGIWLTLSYTERPKATKAFGAGLMFSLAFLTRAEGFLYVLAIPLLLLVYFYWPPRDRAVMPRASRDLPAFLLGFALLAAPQIWRVSSEVGGFAINGRQILMQVIEPGDKTAAAATKEGLDYDPHQTNISYLMSHPEARQRRMAGRGLVNLERARKFAREFDSLQYRQIGRLLGPLGVAFFALGCAALLVTGQRRTAFLVIGLLATMLAGPLLHNVSVMRHILVVAPLAFVVEGLGIAWFAAQLVNSNGRWQTVASVGLATMLIAATARPLWQALRPPTSTNDYSLQDLQAPARLITGIAAEEGLSPPRIAAHKGFLGYHIGAETLGIPHAGYDAVVRYLRFHGADFLYLVYKPTRRAPFWDRFEAGDYAQDFDLLYTGTSHDSHSVELFRLQGLSKGE